MNEVRVPGFGNVRVLVPLAARTSAAAAGSKFLCCIYKQYMCTIMNNIYMICVSFHIHYMYTRVPSSGFICVLYLSTVCLLSHIHYMYTRVSGFEFRDYLCTISTHNIYIVCMLFRILYMYICIICICNHIMYK